MNGVHDVGGMQDMGPIHIEANEPVFHARWEGRVYALNRALGAWRLGNQLSGATRRATKPEKTDCSARGSWGLGLRKQ